MQRLQRLTEDILNVTKIESQSLKLNEPNIGMIKSINSSNNAYGNILSIFGKPFAQSRTGHANVSFTDLSKTTFLESIFRPTPFWNIEYRK
jgi:signal transduction histidine kinase